MIQVLSPTCRQACVGFRTFSPPFGFHVASAPFHPHVGARFKSFHPPASKLAWVSGLSARHSDFMWLLPHFILMSGHASSPFTHLQASLRGFQDFQPAIRISCGFCPISSSCRGTLQILSPTCKQACVGFRTFSVVIRLL